MSTTDAPAPPPRRPRFYRRRRFWAWSGLGVLALVLAVLVAVYWLLQTVAGRDVLLAQIVSRLPVDSSLTWERAEGPVAGPLVLHELEFRYQDYRFTARRAVLDPDIRPLLGFHVASKPACPSCSWPWRRRWRWRAAPSARSRSTAWRRTRRSSRTCACRWA